MRNRITRREFLFASWFPFFFRRRRIRIAGIAFRAVRRGGDRRRFLWIHGNEETARAALAGHMNYAQGRAFFVESSERNVPLAGGRIDPNRMFSRVGAEKSLRTLNPSWTETQLREALAALDKDREKFLRAILPKDGGLIVALHNNGPGYAIQNEIPISDRVAMNNPSHPDEFMLCTSPADFALLSRSPFNVLLQEKAPPEDDGSLSRLAAARGVRYVNIEAALGNQVDQRWMLAWLETYLP
ncbi:MAG: hypothetical protein HYZ57_13470 [Acidobacteria bacterium]|nr:hypothetical protein [Acidobacteriota bacterium]